MTARAAFSAPGKLMLFGEYAVLHGEPALAACFDRQIRCSAEAGGDALVFDAPELLDEVVRLPLSALDAEAPFPELRLLWPLLSRAAPALDGLRLRFDATFPPTWGLGSSSASTLAAVAAVRALLGESPSDLALFREARGLQRRLQGRASGYDAATQLLGGVVWFQDADALTLERVSGPALPLRVAYTGAKASTTKMIGSVTERFPPGSAIYGRIGDLCRDGRALIEGGDLAGLGAAMNAGHALLAELGAVSDAQAAAMARLQAVPGVLGARMCGAGGGDCVLLLAPDPDAAAHAADTVGWELLPLSFTERGLREEAP